MKKIISLLIVVMLLISMFSVTPFNVSAAIVDSGTTGLECTWTLDDTGTLTISGEGGTSDYNAVRYAPWGTNIKKVIVESGVTQIGAEAFLESSQLEKVVLSNTVTIVGRGSFRLCTNLKRIDIPQSVIKIGSDAFASCTNLETIIIPDSVTTITRSSFSNCSKLTIYCNNGSEAQKIARERNIPYKPISEAPTEDEPKPETIIGDLNGDNSVDVLDATIVQKHAVGRADLTPEQIAVADVNNDNNVDILDAAEIQKFAAGKITEFKKKA